jgi:hypothetical protein
MSYATGHNSITSQYLLSIYIYYRFCRLCIINCENKQMWRNIFNYVTGRNVKFVILRNCEYSILYVTLILNLRNNYEEFVISPAVCPSNHKRSAWPVVITLVHKIRTNYVPITQRFSNMSAHGTPLTSRSKPACSLTAPEQRA